MHFSEMIPLLLHIFLIGKFHIMVCSHKLIKVNQTSFIEIIYPNQISANEYGRGEKVFSGALRTKIHKGDGRICSNLCMF